MGSNKPARLGGLGVGGGDKVDAMRCDAMRWNGVTELCR